MLNSLSTLCSCHHTLVHEGGVTVTVVAGSEIDANTSRCKWLGERMDYSLVIESMQFREANAAIPTSAAPS
jgi:hypothetical protein